MSEELDFPNPLFNWKKAVAYLLPILLLSGLIIAKISGKKEQAEKDFLKANYIWSSLSQSFDPQSDQLDHLKALMKKHPELHAKYDGLIAQHLLSTYSHEMATPFADKVLKRAGQPFFHEYTAGSLLIGKREFQEALKMAKELKEEMLNSMSPDYSTLFAFNLLRIATLSFEVGDKEGERAAWKELKLYGKWDDHEKASTPISLDGFDVLLSHFSANEVSLLDFIKYREEALGD